MQLFRSSTTTLRLLVLITILAFSIPLVMLLIPVQHYFTYLSLFNGVPTGPIGATIGGIATPLLLLAGIMVIYMGLREHRQTNLSYQDARATEKEKLYADATTKYILELFALFKQENDKFSPEEVEKVLKTISDSHKNYHDGHIPPLIFTSHLKYILNISAVSLHLNHLFRLLTQLIKVVQNRQPDLPAADYALMISFLDGFNTATSPKLKVLLQLNNTCDFCEINPYDFFSGKDQIVALNTALESINIKPYKI
ncbi:MAG: hypothetical protein JWQ14_2010 [Adhaeribacter sp.]|nr:hypothetical protein [Adhaeribacter sp.]